MRSNLPSFAALTIQTANKEISGASMRKKTKRINDPATMKGNLCHTCTVDLNSHFDDRIELALDLVSERGVRHHSGGHVVIHQRVLRSTVPNASLLEAIHQRLNPDEVCFVDSSNIFFNPGKELSRSPQYSFEERIRLHRVPLST